MKFIGYVIYWLIQWTWGFLQTFIGLIMTLAQGKDCKHELYHGAVVTYHKGNWGGISLGMFTIINGNRPPVWTNDARTHEYGHTIQSLILGPFYLFVVGIASTVWCYGKKFREKRLRGEATYYDFFIESHANSLGACFTGDPLPDWNAEEEERKLIPYERD